MSDRIQSSYITWAGQDGMHLPSVLVDVGDNSCNLVQTRQGKHGWGMGSPGRGPRKFRKRGAIVSSLSSVRGAEKGETNKKREEADDRHPEGW